MQQGTERIGHRSLEAICVYARTNSDQHQMISNVLSDPEEKCYNIQQAQKSVTQKNHQYGPFDLSSAELDELFALLVVLLFLRI